MFERAFGEGNLDRPVSLNWDLVELRMETVNLQASTQLFRTAKWACQMYLACNRGVRSNLTLNFFGEEGIDIEIVELHVERTRQIIVHADRSIDSQNRVLEIGAAGDDHLLPMSDGIEGQCANVLLVEHQFVHVYMGIDCGILRRA